MEQFSVIPLPSLPVEHDPSIDHGSLTESISPLHPSSGEMPSQGQSEDLPSEHGPSQVSSMEPVGWTREIQIFCSTFITIFLAELGDKTQVTTLLMSAESDAPWLVFAGAGTALVVTSLLGVLMGHWLSKRVSPRTLEVAAAMMLLTVSLWLVWDVAQV